MDKEKQIEELDLEIREIIKSTSVLMPRYSKFGGYDGEKVIFTREIAESLYSANCRKITENEIVISKEELYIYKHNIDNLETVCSKLEKQVKEESRETAEKILKEFDALQENLSKKITQLKEPFNRYMNSKEKEGYEKAILAAKSIVTSFKSRLAKQFDVEIGE